MKKEDFNAQQWSSLKNEVKKILIVSARKKAIIWYSDLVAKITLVRLDLHQPDHRAVLACLLGEVSTDEVKEGRAMLSSIVVKKQGDMEPGDGFFQLAEGLGKDLSDKTKFWLNEVKNSFSNWEKR
jgi:hypothetical protein